MPILLQCNDCGCEEEYDDTEQAIDNGWWQDNDDSWYCHNCHGECCQCDQTFPSRQLEWSEPIDGYICEECTEECTVRCESCNSLDFESESYIVDNTRGERVTLCHKCFERLRQNGRIAEENGRWILRNLDERNGFTLQTNLHPEIWNEISNCPDCSGEGEKCPRCLEKMAKEGKEEETTLWIYDNMPRSYHHPLHVHFKSTKLRQKHEHPFLYYGVENELLFHTSTPIDQIAKEYIDATGGLFVAEFDRSVSDAGNGIEFISRPLSYKKWMEESTYQLLEKGNEVLKKYHAYNPQPDCCGLHVHMSLQFFERNTKKSVKEIKSDIDWMFQIYQSEIEKISQRKYTKYCASKAFRCKQVFTGIRGSNYAFNLNPRVEIRKGNLTVSSGSGDTHHDAIIQTYKTIEVRTFKATINTPEILSAIEFCRCVAHAARNMNLDKKSTLGDIIWCKDSKYLPDLIKKTKVDTTKKFENKLEVKI